MSTFTERLIAGATIFGAVAASTAIGYSLGKDTNDGLLNFLREKNQSAERIEAQLRAEISSMQLELQSIKTKQLPARAQPTSVAAAPISASSPTAPSEETITLQPGETAQPFGGKLVISLVSVAFESTTFAHKATATVGAPGKTNKRFDAAPLGTVLLYDNYEIRLVATGTMRATFLVSKLPEGAKTTPKNADQK